MIVSHVHLPTEHPLQIDLPVEVLALRLDIAHAIVGFALPLAAGSLFLASTHDQAVLLLSARDIKVLRMSESVVIAKLCAKFGSRKTSSADH
jgi:hypothetical protein